MSNTNSPKPYHKTSYFLILVGTFILGPVVVIGTSFLLNYTPLSIAQRADLIIKITEQWIFILGIVATGNVAIRGFVTFQKTKAEQGSENTDGND